MGGNDYIITANILNFNFFPIAIALCVHFFYLAMAGHGKGFVFHYCVMRVCMNTLYLVVSDVSSC